MKSKTKIKKQASKKNNPELLKTIRAAEKTKNDFWLKIASIMSYPRRKKIVVNLKDIEKLSKEGESIVVPGKVLSMGEIRKKIRIIAFSFSNSAKEKILKSNSEAVYIIDEIKKNPEAKSLKIIK
ncbi:MAG: 50S ribosomal protein L18e [Candidatus Pacearchaeota archaeon]|nr:MAG: 50S ribosomal protein L18e [Candidatus Pacearchaeota archaeon]